MNDPNATTPPVTEEVLQEIFRSCPVAPDQFLDDPEYLGSFSGYWFPFLKELFSYVEDPDIREAWLGVGKGGAKSTFGAMSIVRGAYELLNLRDWRRIYNMPVGVVLCLNLATSAKQAREVVFEFIRGMVKASPWFQAFPHKVLKDSIEFPAGVIIQCGHSGAAPWAGRAIYRGVIDEADEMTGKSSRLRSEKLYELLVSQSRPRFPGSYKVVMISAITDAGGFMERNVRNIIRNGENIRDEFRTITDE